MTGHQHLECGLFKVAKAGQFSATQLHHLLFNYNESHVEHVLCNSQIDSRDLELCTMFDVLSKISSVDAYTAAQGLRHRMFAA